MQTGELHCTYQVRHHLGTSDAAIERVLPLEVAPPEGTASGSDPTEGTR